jgi:hypothetical protein
MIGCPHCEANKSAWEQAKKEAKKMGFKIRETESRDAPEGMGFPTTRLEEDDGTLVGKEVVGSRDSGDKILKELGIDKKKKKGGRKTRKLRRRSRHRTLRNHVSFV